MDPSATDDIHEMLSEEKVLAVGVALAQGTGEFIEGEWEEAMKQAIRWASLVRINGCQLDLALAGRLAGWPLAFNREVYSGATWRSGA